MSVQCLWNWDFQRTSIMQKVRSTEIIVRDCWGESCKAFFWPLDEHLVIIAKQGPHKHQTNYTNALKGQLILKF